MSAGKAAAQAVHAAMMLQNSAIEFADDYKRTVIILEAENAEQLRNLSEYLDDAGIFSQYYIDEGQNEVGTYSLTALAVEPIDSKDTEKREIFGSFRLFSGETDYYRAAARYLHRVSSSCQEYDGMIVNDGTPRFVKKTIKWLNKRR